MKRLIIDFPKYEQMKIFMEWFKDFGFDEFTNSDFVHDDLSSENFPKKIKKMGQVRCEDYEAFIEII